MPRGRRKGDHDSKREEIADATCKVILRSGIEKSGIAEIAREMGCSTGVVMHYFKSKAEMLLYSKNLMFDRAHERMKQAAANGHGPERLLAMTRELLPLDAASIARCRLLTAFMGLAVGNSALMKLQDKRDLLHIKQFAGVIVDLQATGAISTKLDPMLEGRRICALIDGIASQAATNPRSWSPADIEATMSRHLQSIMTSTI